MNLKNREKHILIIGGFILFASGIIKYLINQQRCPCEDEPNANATETDKIMSKRIHDSVLSKRDSIENASNNESIQEESSLSEVNSIMSPEAEKRILSKLEDFENSKIFTNSNISLSGLASHYDTNTKYLSFVINHFKQMNYNQYINELRIKYIVEKLTNEPIYRKYKFSALAKEAGFSSPNKFSTIFKTITNESPSIFIKRLESELEEE